jgi:hypothetical protein
MYRLDGGPMMMGGMGMDGGSKRGAPWKLGTYGGTLNGCNDDASPPRTGCES